MLIFTENGIDRQGLLAGSIMIACGDTGRFTRPLMCFLSSASRWADSPPGQRHTLMGPPAADTISTTVGQPGQPQPESRCHLEPFPKCLRQLAPLRSISSDLGGTTVHPPEPKPLRKWTRDGKFFRRSGYSLQQTYQHFLCGLYLATGCGEHKFRAWTLTVVLRGRLACAKMPGLALATANPVGGLHNNPSSPFNGAVVHVV